ncbi:DUF5071 domain-containing protein [Paenibacillus massiliensis]|uniref:DUF5071 domain-containing protein n=1 Tax=Paenibacillus massiliensis TaxID=225917 RepID=UPI000A04BC1D
MSELLNLLPSDKHDFDKVRQLKSIDKNERIQLIPHLLEWLQDMNTCYRTCGKSRIGQYAA